jgi:hypothetical protein
MMNSQYLEAGSGVMVLLFIFTASLFFVTPLGAWTNIDHFHFCMFSSHDLYQLSNGSTDCCRLCVRLFICDEDVNSAVLPAFSPCSICCVKYVFFLWKQSFIYENHVKAGSFTL